MCFRIAMSGAEVIAASAIRKRTSVKQHELLVRQLLSTKISCANQELPSRVDNDLPALVAGRKTCFLRADEASLGSLFLLFHRR